MSSVAFILTGWKLSSYIMQVAEALAQNGVDVAIFYETSHPPVVDDIRMQGNPRIRCLPLKNSFHKMFSRKEISSFLAVCVDEICGYSSERSYSVIIGVEKVGVAVAFLTAKRLKAPLLYWSLELYDLQHPGWGKSVGSPEPWLEMETLACKAADKIIIQDEDRANALASITGVSHEYIFLPIAIGRNEIAPWGSTLLHDICHIDHGQKILLQFGYNRMPLGWLSRMAEALPPGWCFVLHGLLTPPDMQHPRLYFSTTKYPENTIAQIIASATIGLVHYENRHINDALTVHSSEKLARYLATGIPVLAHNIGKFSIWLEHSHAGLSYTNPEQVGEAVRHIEKNLKTFQNAALKAGEAYIFEDICSGLLSILQAYAS